MFNISLDFGKRHGDIIGRRCRMGAVELISILAQSPQIGFLAFGSGNNASGCWVTVEDGSKDLLDTLVQTSLVGTAQHQQQANRLIQWKARFRPALGPPRPGPRAVSGKEDAQSPAPPRKGPAPTRSGRLFA